jgi:uncharacterized protein YdaT
MPWTKTNYPNSMKNLPVAVRTKAIAIANAMLKGNKKMKEGIIIATATKNAKELADKNGKKKKTKIVAKKKTKIVAKKKVKTVVRAKARKPAKAKAKTPVVKTVVTKKRARSKNPYFIPVASSAEKKIKTSSENNPKSVVATKSKRPAKAETETPIVEIPVIPKITHGDDLHFIPVQGETHPVRNEEARKVENIFHNREEVAFHQENQRVKQSLSTRKGAKVIYRTGGRGH